MSSARHRSLVALAVLLGGASAAPTGEVRHASQEFRWRGGADKVAVADLDGDGLDDLLVARGRRLELHRQDAGGAFRLETPDAVLDLPGASTGWDLDRAAGSPAWRILAVVDGRELREWSLARDGRGFADSSVAAGGLFAFLPRGVRHLAFIHDVDGDGDGDLVLPGSGVFQTFLRGPDGSFARGPSASAEIHLDVRLNPDGDLTARIGRSVRLPFLDLRDVNGDGRRDLVSKTDDRLEVYLARDGGGLEGRPDVALDIAARRERLGRFDPDKLDLSNLTGALAYTLETRFEDIDGDGIADLLLREGGKVSIFLGRADGIDLEKPDQVLKSAGNVLSAFLLDEDGDGKKELWLARIEAVSIGEVFVWLVASGSLEFEAFVYRREGRTFARRPARKLTVALRFPSIFNFPDVFDRIEERMKEQDPAAVEAADLVKAGRRGDLFLLRGGELRAYIGGANSAFPDRDASPLLELLDYRSDRDDYQLDLESLVERLRRGRDEAESIGDGRPADFSIALSGAARGSGLFVMDLNRDGVDDALLIFQNDSAALAGAVVVSRRAP